MGVSSNVFGYWLVITKYQELGIQIPRISGHGCRTQHCVHGLFLCSNMFHGRCMVFVCASMCEFGGLNSVKGGRM